MRDQEPQWQPIERLPLIASLVDGGLDDAREFRETIRRADAEPHVLDDATVERSLRLHTEKLEYVEIYEEQFTRWKRGELSIVEEQEVDRLVSLLPELRTLLGEILAVLSRVKEGTIDKILEMDDLELGIRTLLGEIKTPKR